MKKIIGLAMCVACMALCAENAFKIVHGRGRNAEYRDAINEALAQAMSQVQGVSLQDSRDSLMDSLVQVRKTTKDNATSLDEIRQSLKQSVAAKSRGYIASFNITQEIFNKDLGLWFVDVDAKVPDRFTLEPPDDRRRMVVIPFRSTVNNEVDIFGTKVVLRERSEEIARRLNDRLVQTRRFNMLDREFDEDTSAELSRLDMDNASPGDIVRRSQKLVTDYMVVGTFRIYDSPKIEYNQFTGTSSMGNALFLEVSYRVLVVPTSQLKWANTIKIPYSACVGSDVKNLLSQGMEVAARMVTNEIIDNVYPVRVTDKTSFELVLNQGGNNYVVGETLLAFRSGKLVVDVASGEELGEAEEQIASLRVSRVTPKMTYATVVEGTPFDQIPVGSIVRRPMNVAGGAYLQLGRPSETGVNSDGSVVPPWKRK